MSPTTTELSHNNNNNVVIIIKINISNNNNGNSNSSNRSAPQVAKDRGIGPLLRPPRVRNPCRRPTGSRLARLTGIELTSSSSSLRRVDSRSSIIITKRVRQVYCRSNIYCSTKEAPKVDCSSSSSRIIIKKVRCKVVCSSRSFTKRVRGKHDHRIIIKSSGILRRVDCSSSSIKSRSIKSRFLRRSVGHRRGGANAWTRRRSSSSSSIGIRSRSLRRAVDPRRAGADARSRRRRTSSRPAAATITTSPSSSGGIVRRAATAEEDGRMGARIYNPHRRRDLAARPPIAAADATMTRAPQVQAAKPAAGTMARAYPILSVAAPVARL